MSDPRRFQLVRDVDETGVSGTGVIVEGVEFTDGTIALRWLTGTTSTAVYASIGDVETIHGHGGKTRVEWVDDVASADAGRTTPDNPVASTIAADNRDVRLEPTAEAWRRKAIQRGLKAGRLRTVLDAVHELTAIETPACNEWSIGYQGAIDDLRELLRELDQDGETPAETGRIDNAYWAAKDDGAPE